MSNCLRIVVTDPDPDYLGIEIFVFGTKHKGCAGGYCALKFYCRDGSGHSAVEVELEDDDTCYSEAEARFTFFPVVAAEIDRFVAQLRSVERAQSGEAKLENMG